MDAEIDSRLWTGEIPDYRAEFWQWLVGDCAGLVTAMMYLESRND